MARNRVIYQSEALFINKDASLTGGYKQLERVQSANYSFSINRQDINQYGQLGKLDSIQLDAPTVNADCSYYVTDGFTERAMGFFVATGNQASTAGGFVSGHLADGSGRNLIILTTPEGTDADLPSRATGTTDSAIGIGNCYLSDYSVEMSVGSIPTASVSFDALNINSNQVGPHGAGFDSPAIDPVNGTALTNKVVLPQASTGQGNTAALRPGDITVNISQFDGIPLADIGLGASGAHIQSASLSVPMSRSTLERLGSRSAYARSVDFPIQASLSVSAILNEVETSNLADIIDDEVEKTVTLTLKKDDGATGILYTLKGVSFDGESISSSIGSNKSVDLTFSTSVGGPNDTSHGVFMSGSSTTAV
jgi:hypothetical protein